jgi:DNA replication and repair protein RecF
LLNFTVEVLDEATCLVLRGKYNVNLPITKVHGSLPASYFPASLKFALKPFLLSLNRLSLTQFRNYDRRDFGFTERVVGICGPNGVGKTNLLDAIHYLCFTRSYFSRTDAGSVKTGSGGFRIEGDWSVGMEKLNTVCILRENGKKEFLVDREPCARFSTHVGRLPVVFIAPDDIGLITNGSEDRRKFMDTLLSQLDAKYLQMLIRYNRILSERNSFLKQAAAHPHGDLDLLDVFDEQLAEAGQWIFTERARFMQTFLPAVLRFYEVIAGTSEKPSISYKSRLFENELHVLLAGSRQQDLVLQRTRYGVHRDDLEFQLQGEAFRMIGSQGQRKSLLFALKLAEFEMLREAKGFPPLLLLDDIFEKLDQGRMQNLLDWVCIRNAGQVFLTDTHEKRVREVMLSIGVDFQYLGL